MSTGRVRLGVPDGAACAPPGHRRPGRRWGSGAVSTVEERNDTTGEVCRQRGGPGDGQGGEQEAGGGGGLPALCRELPTCRALQWVTENLYNFIVQCCTGCQARRTSRCSVCFR